MASRERRNDDDVEEDDAYDEWLDQELEKLENVRSLLLESTSTRSIPFATLVP